jgi:predicted house-cleaning NTP pyrophosphatase (Maf/HAM1 superfamily)
MIIFLASSSVARLKLLTNAGFKVKKIEHSSNEIIENQEYKRSLLNFVQEVSRLKIESINLKDVFQKAEEDNIKKFMLLVCDSETMIEEGSVLGKPELLEIAKKIFLEANNKKMYVISYFRYWVFKKINNVWEKKSSEEGYEKTFLILDWNEKEIDNYINIMKDNILKISGGFDPEGLGALYIKHIEGNFSNYLGFPMYEFNKKYKLSIDNVDE